ncbi:hypothetical protein BOTBODRAFT_451857 [Botryobasidium botryosum FD-172 SS1]|uniref:Uncharacterized protein n=1 Tax=Botryobasidium botryosum (strain FD-172 SS1) TaxID=930990 RepID=A0A067MIY8_BOTB1|nr:hypothetical protein BOTBODRAFT_451857 [Botryobasidium botryosum FD-172 SS1]
MKPFCSKVSVFDCLQSFQQTRLRSSLSLRSCGSLRPSLTFLLVHTRSLLTLGFPLHAVHLPVAAFLRVVGVRRLLGYPR